MRPLSGGDAFGASSRLPSFSDNDATPLAARNHAPQMTCFFADENSIGDSAPSPLLNPKQRDLKDSNYGVESIETTISSLSASHEDHEPRPGTRRHKKRNPARVSKEDEDDLTDVPSTDVSGSASPFHTRRASQTTISRPFTPLSLGSPAPPSLMSSAGSRRNSDAGSFLDDVASQAIASSGDEGRDMESTMMDSGSAPQLVMPSIKMPSRRPFTERGKHLGRLKIVIAGDTGVGKTSLIKAIVQTCEDIVHVDPLTTTTVAIPERRKSSQTKSRSRSAGSIATTEVTEIYASTRAYPSWWSDLEESRILRRRKSLGDSVLERNLCFVDTPGYGNKTSCLESIVPVVDYIESHFKKMASVQDMSDSETISMLSGNGGTQVDLVFYVFAKRVKPVDVEYLRRLAGLTNIIPLISRSDLLSGEELAQLKENIVSAFATNSVKPFSFDQLFDGSHPEAPYAISSMASKDDETMDASLLMSPDYVQPLLESELPFVVSHIFERDTVSWLRHSAAKKFVQWRAGAGPPPHDGPRALYRPLSQHLQAVPPTSSLSGLAAGAGTGTTAPMTTTTTTTTATTSYALARVSDHTQREERIAQVRLANWAADLQRSLANERRRFEQLAHSERAVWLTERLGECVQDGSIVPVSRHRDAYDGLLVEKSYYSRKRRGGGGGGGRGKGAVDPHDPLGLLRLNADVRRRSWIALQLVSSLGVLGGLAYYITRSWQVAESESAGVWEWILDAM